MSAYTQKQLLEIVEEQLKNHPKIIQMFRSCFRNTLETTIKINKEDDTVFMCTGDIPAMWLRDSVNQLRPYLIYAESDSNLRYIIEGVIKKQLKSILLDPYANAFNEDDNNAGHQTDITEMKGYIWERKYEIDSLCYPIQLCYLYWKNTGITAHFNSLFLEALKEIIKLWQTEQYHMEKSPYTFERRNVALSDTLPCGGKGNPVGYTGMLWSGFRPSDDACQYGYLVPSNMFAVVVLGYSIDIIDTFYKDENELLEQIKRLKSQIEEGIEKYAVFEDPEYGTVYAYETDGLGNRLFMDDANVPSLLSLPYMGYCQREDKLYQSTRNMALSSKNPYYYEGTYAKGIGSPHTPENYIWHIALSIQGMTSLDEHEKSDILKYFETTDAGTALVHEGFHKDDPTQYTREWFSWSNAMFVEFVLSYCGIHIKTN